MVQSLSDKPMVFSLNPIQYILVSHGAQYSVHHIFKYLLMSLPSAVHQREITLYADDSLLFYRGNPMKVIESYLSADLSDIINWLDSNSLSLSYSKTKVMSVVIH